MKYELTLKAIKQNLNVWTYNMNEIDYAPSSHHQLLKYIKQPKGEYTSWLYFLLNAKLFTMHSIYSHACFTFDLCIVLLYSPSNLELYIHVKHEFIIQANSFCTF